MKLEINGIKREVQIIQAPQGSFCYDDTGIINFPLFVAICEPTEEELSWGDVLVCPIFDGNGGYAGITVNEVKNELWPFDLKRLIRGYAERRESDNLKEAVEDIMGMFEMHKTPISLSVREYVNDVMNGTITKIPTNE